MRCFVINTEFLSIQIKALIINGSRNQNLKQGMFQEIYFL